MLKIINDYGVSVVAIGQEGSQARVACERQKLIDVLADCIYAGDLDFFRFVLARENFPDNLGDYIAKQAQERAKEMGREEFSKWAIAEHDERERGTGYAGK